MKAIVRIAIGVLVLSLVGVVAAAILVPRLLDRPEVRTRISAGAKQVTGRDFSWDRLDVTWLPPGFTMTGATLQPAASEAPLRAERVALRVAFLPLFAGVVAIDALEVEGAEIEVVRTPDGIKLPFDLPANASDPASTDAPSVQPVVRDTVDGGEDDPIALAVQRITVRDVRLTLVDRSLPDAPTLTVVVDQADASGGLRPNVPIPFAATGRLLSGGDFEIEGEASLDRTWSGSLALSDVDLAPFAPWVPGMSMTGTAAVGLEASGSAANVDTLALGVVLQKLDAKRDDLVVRGSVMLTWDATGNGADGLGGALEAVLTKAHVSQGSALAKPIGDVLEIAGPFVLDADGGMTLSGARVTLPGVVAAVDAQTAPRIQVKLATPLFDPAELASWLPAASDLPVTGRIGFEDWIVQLDPLTLSGGMHVDDVRIPLEAGQFAQLTGMFEGQGTALVGNGLAVEVAGQALTATVRLDGLDGTPTARIQADGHGLEAERLLQALGASTETLSGSLDFTADLAVPLGGEGSPMQAARGNAQWSIAPGRVKGVSLLRSTFDAFGGFGELALLGGQAFGGSTLQRFYGDEFERASSTVTLRDGIVRTDDLALDYRHYRAELEGTVRLADRALDMTGQLTLFEEIDRALGEAVPVPTPDTGRSVDRVIPLARVSGTLDDPKVQLTRAAVLAFSQDYLGRRGRLDRYKGKVDDKLGEGAGDAVIDILEGILGGERRR